MAKKISIFTIMVIMLLGIFGLTGCSNGSLSDYKNLKLSELQSYSHAKGQHNYSESSWEEVCKALTNGKASIKKSLSRISVNKACKKAKKIMNVVERNDINLEWTNENIVYASVRLEFENDILQDITVSFKNLHYKKVYVTKKYISEVSSLELLFILEESSNREEFIDILKQDKRILHVYIWRDLPYETIDTTHMERSKDTITVGETLTLQPKGHFDAYIQRFSFNSVIIQPMTDKICEAEDFPFDIKSIEKRSNGWLFLELATENYFNVIKTLDIVSRLSYIEKVDKDYSNIISIPPPEWCLSNWSIVKFDFIDNGNSPIAVIKGIKAGTVRVNYGAVDCLITVI